MLDTKRYDLRKCRNCQEMVPRIANGKYPNGKDTKYVDLNGSQWNGNYCPKCVRSKNKAYYHTKKANDTETENTNQ